MLDKINAILSSITADFADLRYEKKNETKITFDGPEISQITSSTTDGYVLRILLKGGFSSVAFTKESDKEKAIAIALENARLMAEFSPRPTRLATTEKVKDAFFPDLNEDPRRISIEEKIGLVRRYNRIALDHDRILTTSINYLENNREKFYVNTEGVQIREDLITTSISGLITSADGSLIQPIRVSVGGGNGFSILRNREAVFEERKKLAVDLLAARPVVAGEHDVILNNSMAGLFAHEAFGHFSEADLIQDNPAMRQKMHIGARLGNEILSITDDPTIPGQLGFYRYDDEGVKAKPVALLKNGVLTGRLHSRRTAPEFDEPVNGHCVAEDYHFAPIIRMGTIFIQPGTDSREQLFSKLDDGLYIVDARGGQTMGENFTFGAQYGYIVKRGKIGSMVRDINITGNLYHTMKNIVGIADDLMLDETGGCGKGQLNIRSCHGGPHILVRNVILGGK